MPELAHSSEPQRKASSPGLLSPFASPPLLLARRINYDREERLQRLPKADAMMLGMALPDDTLISRTKIALVPFFSGQ